MIPLKYNTGGQVVVFGPFLDTTDGITNETALVISAGLIKFHKANALVLSTHSLSGATHSASGLYTVTLGTGDTDVYGPMTGYIDVAGALATKLEFLVMEANAYDAMLAALGTGYVEANITQISDDATAAQNLEATYDGTGYTEDSAPAKQSQLASLSNVGSAVHRPAASYTLTTGTQSANTYASTEALDGTRHEHTDDTGAMELYYEFNIGSGTPSSVQVSGYITGPNDDLDVYGYDWVAAGWVQIGNIQGSSSTSNAVNSLDMFVDMVGSGANAGVVRVRLYKASGLTSALLAVDQIFVAFNQGVSGYEGGAVWFDSTASNTNTVVGVDGTATNPVSTMGAVNTLLAATNLNIVQVAPGSTVTLAAAQNNQVFKGNNWTLALGGQDIAGSHFFGASSVSGTGVGASTVDFHDCLIGTCTLNPFHAHECGFTGTVTFGAAGDYLLDKGYSAIAGSGTPVFDTGAAIANVNLTMPGWKNGTEIQNLNNTGTDLFSISGIGQIIYAASSSGAVNQRGSWRVTNTGGVTITEDDNTSSITIIETDTADMQPKLGSPAGASISADNAAIKAETALIVTDTNELQTDDVPGLIAALNNISTAQVNTECDTAITDAALATAAALAVVDAVADAIKVVTDSQARAAATIQDGAAVSGTLSTTEMTTDLTVSIADQFNGRIITFADDTTTAALRGQSTDITATTVSGSKLGFTALTTAPVVGDTFSVT